MDGDCIEKGLSPGGKYRRISDILFFGIFGVFFIIFIDFGFNSGKRSSDCFPLLYFDLLLFWEFRFDLALFYDF